MSMYMHLEDDLAAHLLPGRDAGLALRVGQRQPRAVGLAVEQVHLYTHAMHMPYT